MIIGRKQEQEMIRRAVESRESEFIAVYGRRRVGKTYLVREFFNNDFAFYHAGAAKTSMRGQLEFFRNAFVERGESDCPSFSSWVDAFSYLKKFLSKRTENRKIVFLDEIAWMDTPKSNFLAALENFWNTWASARKDIVLVICASASSWIIKKVFKNRGGLHNRITCRIKLSQFSLKECEEYSEYKGFGFERSQIAEYYMVLGGVPFYWSLLNKSLSVSQNINALFFGENAMLANEFKELYASIFKNPTLHLQIIHALGSKSSGLSRNELISSVKENTGGYLSTALEELEECGLIRSYRPFDKVSKGAVYQLADCFTQFHLHFLAKGKKDQDYWIKTFNSPEINAWRGLAFEKIIALHEAQLKAGLGIEGVVSSFCSWSRRGDSDRRGAQIDLLVDRADGIINIIEEKWSRGQYEITRDVMDDVWHKVACFRDTTSTRKGIHITFVTPFGLAHNSYWNDVNSELTLEDLFHN